MKVLIACEYSGVVRRAFEERGHDAWSCDLLPSDDGSQKHIQGDVESLLSEKWSLIIAHPPCTYLTISAEWAYKPRGQINKKLSPEKLYGEERELARNEALKFIELIWQSNTERLCIENPVGVIRRRLEFMPNPQYVHPYMFGDDASKKTGLWMRGLPELIIPPSCEWAKPRIVHSNGKQYQRWANQTDSGQNALAPTKDRWKIRSATYQGIANAMAENWG